MQHATCNTLSARRRPLFEAKGAHGPAAHAPFFRRCLCRYTDFLLGLDRLQWTDGSIFCNRARGSPLGKDDPESLDIMWPVRLPYRCHHPTMPSLLPGSSAPQHQNPSHNRLSWIDNHRDLVSDSSLVMDDHSWLKVWFTQSGNSCTR